MENLIICILLINLAIMTILLCRCHGYLKRIKKIDNEIDDIKNGYNMVSNKNNLR